MPLPLALDPQFGPELASTRSPAAQGSVATRARAQAQDFEATFLNSMFQNMFTDMGGDGPLGGGPGVGIWRSFLTDQYAKSFAKAGGVGLADQVYRSLLAHQEARGV
jgi:Rod binding domain-containing protein